MSDRAPVLPALPSTYKSSHISLAIREKKKRKNSHSLSPIAMATQSGTGIVDILILVAGVGYTGTVLIKTGNLFGLIREFKLLGKRLLRFGDQAEGAEGKADNAAQVSRVRSTITKETLGERLDRMTWMENHPDPLLADLIDFALYESWDLPDPLQQEQLELSGRSPGLLTFSGTPDLKLQGLKSTVETLSNSLDRSASDSIVLDGMDKPEQKRKPLSRFELARFWFFESFPPCGRMHCMLGQG